MYIVLDTNRPAEYPLSHNWGNSRFETFGEALKYAKDWLGEYWNPAFEDKLRAGEVVAYSGYGDTIHICEVE